MIYDFTALTPNIALSTINNTSKYAKSNEVIASAFAHKEHHNKNQAKLTMSAAPPLTTDLM